MRFHLTAPARIDSVCNLGFMNDSEAGTVCGHWAVKVKKGDVLERVTPQMGFVW